jgi:hypothetical protein
MKDEVGVVMLGFMLSALLFVMPAKAEKFELSVTSSLQSVLDPRWEKISAAPLHSATGLTMGYAMSDRISLVAGFNTGRTGSRLLIPDESGTEDEPLGFNIAATVIHYQFGVRYRWKWKRRWVPTTTVMFQLGHGILRMDENVNVEGKEVTNRYAATALGFEFGGGMEYTFAFLNDEKVRVNLGLETGFTNLFEWKFEDDDSSSEAIPLGILDMGGIYMTLSLGTRF